MRIQIAVINSLEPAFFLSLKDKCLNKGLWRENLPQLPGPHRTWTCIFKAMLIQPSFHPTSPALSETVGSRLGRRTL